MSDTPKMPANISDLVKQRIQAQFVDLIPEDVWSGMVEAQIQDFTKPKAQSSGQGSTYMSDLQKMILDHVKSMFQAKIVEELKDPKYMAQWDYNGGIGVQVAPAIIQEIVDKHSHRIFANIVGGMVMQVMSNMPRTY